VKLKKISDRSEEEFEVLEDSHFTENGGKKED
jgi:hypothetical protein